MNTSGRNGRLFCCLQLYYEIRWHVSYFYLFKMAGEKSSTEKDVSESLKQCCESLAFAARGPTETRIYLVAKSKDRNHRK